MLGTDLTAGDEEIETLAVDGPHAQRHQPWVCEAAEHPRPPSTSIPGLQVDSPIRVEVTTPQAMQAPLVAPGARHQHQHHNNPDQEKR